MVWLMSLFLSWFALCNYQRYAVWHIDFIGRMRDCWWPILTLSMMWVITFGHCCTLQRLHSSYNFHAINHLRYDLFSILILFVFKFQKGREKMKFAMCPELWVPNESHRPRFKNIECLYTYLRNIPSKGTLKKIAT